MEHTDADGKDGQIMVDWVEEVLDHHARQGEHLNDEELAEARLIEIAAELLDFNTLEDGYLIAHPKDPQYLYKLTLWVAEEGYEGDYGALVVAKMEELRGGVVIDDRLAQEALAVLLGEASPGGSAT
jgi:hypothetical protein